MEEKLEEIFEKEWVKMNWQACSTIQLCLTKDQKYFVMRETVARLVEEIGGQVYDQECGEPTLFE